MSDVCVNICKGVNNRGIIQDRRQKIWTLTTRSMKGYEIAKELNVDPSTISRDIQYLTSQSQKFLDDLSRKTLPYMYQTSIEGIREVIKMCWNIYEQSDEDKDKLAALRLIKDSNESIFHLVDEGPSVLYLRLLQNKLSQINENRQIH
jgi:IS30 family transposase